MQFELQMNRARWTDRRDRSWNINRDANKWRTSFGYSRSASAIFTRLEMVRSGSLLGIRRLNDIILSQAEGWPIDSLKRNEIPSFASDPNNLKVAHVRAAGHAIQAPREILKRYEIHFPIFVLERREINNLPNGIWARFYLEI